MNIPTEVVIAAITSTLGLIGVVFTAIISMMNGAASKKLKKIMNEINDAVNHRHDKKGPDAPKLYDLIWENHEKADELIQWKRSYDGGPLDNGIKVMEFFEETNSRLNTIETKITDLDKKCSFVYSDSDKDED